MMMPDFLLIGAPKSGTTSVYRYLSQHPHIFMSANKEPHFFAFEDQKTDFCGPGDDKAWLNVGSIVTLKEYQDLWKDARAKQVKGEASTMYLYLPESCDRIHRHAPNTKLIAILRHPVDRAYSHYMHLRREGREWEEDFQTALQAEPKRIGQHWSPAWHYRQASLYGQQLKRYLDVFPKSQIKIFLYDDLKKDVQSVIQEVLQFLELDPTVSWDLSKKHNATTHVRKHQWLHTFLTQPNPVKQVLRTVLPANIRKPLATKAFKTNVKVAEGLDAEVRQALIPDFKEDILTLQTLLDRDLSHWLAS